MRIKAFGSFVKNEAIDYELEYGSTAVIDAQRLFYDLYEKSRLPYSLGSESNRFASYLKERLINFKEANLKCFFVFRGSSKNIKNKFDKKINDAKERDSKRSTVNDYAFVLPIFAYNICKQVLDDMNFVYVNCPLEGKDYCITLAKTFDCPIISQDIDFALMKAAYIPYDNMVFNKQTNSFRCVKFNLDTTLQKYGINHEKLILIIVLTSVSCFPEDHFNQFFQNNRFPCNNYHRIQSLFKWLSHITTEQALVNIYKYLNDEDISKFILMVQETSANLKESQEGIPLNLFLYGDRAQFIRNDPMWFEKGVTNKFIAKQYIDLYYSNVYIYNKTVYSQENKNEYRLSTDIIIYAYNLLTNYTKDQFSLNYSNGEIVTDVDTRKLPFPKPVYEADTSVFENGWDEIKNLGLLEYFLSGTMKGIGLKYLEEIPDDAKLLMISLTYYTVKSPNETLDELYSILLSYVMLGIVFEDRDDVNITNTDYKTAIAVTKKYFESNEAEIKFISDSEMIYPLTEFQHCLEEMNYLNALCGYPYKPTIYSKTYNGTFVYKILHSLKTKDLDREDFLVNILGLPSTVYGYLIKMSIVHERLISSIEK